MKVSTSSALFIYTAGDEVQIIIEWLVRKGVWGRQAGRKEGDKGWRWFSFFCERALCSTKKNTDSIIDVVISITIFFFVLEPICIPFHPDFRNQLKKSETSLEMFFYSFISSLTASLWLWSVPIPDLLKINICLINMLTHLLIASFKHQSLFYSCSLCNLYCYYFPSNYMCSSFVAKSNSCHHSCQIDPWHLNYYHFFSL